MTVRQFRKVVLDHYKKEGRHDLPWRKTHDPYKILVSEIMLQQTQVERVIPYYCEWIKKYPSAKALAAAPLSSVLKSWQGLGYNRRGKALWEAARELQKLKKFPRTRAELKKLPGIGDYTAGAVLTFAYDMPEVFLETNIRTAITHHFFNDEENVDDKLVLEKLKEVTPKNAGREWGWALMDYGASLKKNGIRINSKAKGYTKQKTFLGSDRQARGAILKELATRSASKSRLLGLLGDDRTEQLALALAKLEKEGMVEKNGRMYCLPD